MRNFVFGRTRYDYIPYHDYYKLVELAGFTWQYLDTINWYDPTLTVIATPLNGEWFSIPADHTTYLIHWNLERFNPEQPIESYKYHYNEVWASDKAMADVQGATFVFLGGHRAFGNVNHSRRNFDYITLAANFGRRSPILHNLSQQLTCADMDGGTWGENRHNRLMQSKVMINLHQDDLLWSEPIRFMLAGAYAMPILSEPCQNPGVYESGVHYLTCTADEMPQFTRWLCQYDVIAAKVAANLWRLTCVDKPFKKCVLEALNGTN